MIEPGILAPGTQIQLSYSHDSYPGALATVTETRTDHGTPIYSVTMTTFVMPSDVRSIRRPDGTWTEVQ
jgi:hypothetical protein